MSRLIIEDCGYASIKEELTLRVKSTFDCLRSDHKFRARSYRWIQPHQTVVRGVSEKSIHLPSSSTERERIAALGGKNHATMNCEKKMIVTARLDNQHLSIEVNAKVQIFFQNIWQYGSRHILARGYRIRLL